MVNTEQNFPKHNLILFITNTHTKDRYIYIYAKDRPRQNKQTSIICSCKNDAKLLECTTIMTYKNGGYLFKWTAYWLVVHKEELERNKNLDQ